MQVCAGLASGECRRKAPCRRVFDGSKTLKDFVIFGGFEVQRGWESSQIVFSDTPVGRENDRLK
jgi:hypothetical protein